MVTNGVITQLLQKINQLNDAVNLLNSTVDTRFQKLEGETRTFELII